MSQHDYVIANASGATVRADLNSLFQAMLSQNSGTSAPTTTAAGMFWLDTTGGAPYTLKIRDAGNNHWLTVLSLTDPGSDGNVSVAAIEGSAVLSTGESGGSKFLREDGDGSCSWQSLTTGKILQINQVVDQSLTERTGDKSAWELVPNMTCTLASNLQSGSKLFASFSGIYGEEQGNWYACTTAFTLFQNSTTVAGNQISGLDTDHGLTQMAAPFSTQNYWREPFSSSALFTPTGDDTAKKSVSLYWRNLCNNAFSSYLNRPGSSNAVYQAGATVLTLMEIGA